MKITGMIASGALGLFAMAMIASRPAHAESTTVPVINEPEIWKDPAQAPEARAKDLMRRMTLEERASQIIANTPAIPRLGIVAYSHRNECLHGLANTDNATVFPQAIAMAATWDTPLIHEEAEVIATEGRGKHNDYVAKHNGNSGEHAGVNFYSPNINIFRDPRWGRGQETYGEDPFLTGQMGVAFIRGLQGDDPKYFKAVACEKHYAVHSGPEKERHTFDAKPSDRDLYETYLPAFEAAVREGHVYSAMGAYSSLNGVPCCANPFLLTALLRKQWGFDGVVFSDGGAIGDVWAEHKFVPGPVEAAAAAVKAGCDVSSGGQQPPRPTTDPSRKYNGLKGGKAFSLLPQAVEKGLITEAEVNQAVERELVMRFKLGLFDPPESAPFATIGMDQVDTPQHRALALKVAQESIVLLKNDGLLPLDRTKLKHIVVMGPNCDAAHMQNGNYSGQPSKSVTILQGIQQFLGSDVQVTHITGCPCAVREDKSNEPTAEALAKAVDAAKSADVVIFVSGIDSTLEKEEGGPREKRFDGFDRGDRTRIELPPQQEQWLKALADTQKPIVLVNCSGSAMAMPWEAEHLQAVVQAWYPGEEGGTAVAQVLFGDVNPAGRLPVTFYASTEDLPAFDDYSMANRTYKYFTGKPLFAFGRGLSYTKFDYSDAKVDGDSAGPGDKVKLSFKVSNAGERDGDEVAQVYFRRAHAKDSDPKLALCGFTRLHLAKGESKTLSLEIPAAQFRSWDDSQKRYVVESGEYELLIGEASDDIRLHAKVAVK